ncbi:MAG: tetratricopeptide repeat protein [Verrucomicrobiota bacterium]
MRFYVTQMGTGAGYLCLVVLCWSVPLSARGQDSTPEELWNDGRKAFATGQFKRAELCFDELVGGYGQVEELGALLAEVVPWRGLAKACRKKFREAEPLLEQGLERNGLPERVKQEMRFWLAVCCLDQKRFARGREVLAAYGRSPGGGEDPRREEALLLYGSLFLLDGQVDEGIAFLEKQRASWKSGGAEMRCRSSLLILKALTGSDQWDRALALVREEYPHLDSYAQVVSFQTLGLDLGARLLRAKRYREAIVALQRIAPRERLLTLQTRRLADLKEEVKAASAREGGAGRAFRLEGIIRREERELARFREIDDWDLAVRLRLARAYQGLGRLFEAGLVLEAILMEEPGENRALLEAAGLGLVQCWSRLKRWDRVASAADRYDRLFGKEDSKRAALVLFLKAESFRERSLWSDARSLYESLEKGFPDSPLQSKARLLRAICLLSEERFDESIGLLGEIEKGFPRESEVLDSVAYWRAMAFSFGGNHLESLKASQDYQNRFPKGKYAEDAAFREAFSAHALADYSLGIALFEAFIKTHGKGRYRDEALLLTGDAHLARGDLDEGMASYARISEGSVRFFEDGWFKTGKALRLSDQVEAMRGHFTEFVEERPGSGRLAEAAYWVGWSHEQTGDRERARRLYRQLIDEHGDDPEQRSVEELLLALGRLHPGEEREVFIQRFRADWRRKQKGRKSGEGALEVRMLWAFSQLGGEASKRQDWLLDAARLVDSRIHGPLIAADCAEARLASGHDQLAEKLFLNLRRWHPAAVEMDRVYFGLATIAHRRERDKEAIGLIDRLRRRAVGSPLMGKGLLLQAACEENQGEPLAARKTLRSLLEAEWSGSRDRAEALVRLGRLWAQGGDDRKAAACLERVYVAYGRHRDLVEMAYDERVACLQRLGLEAAAEEVQRERVERFKRDGGGKPVPEPIANGDSTEGEA